MNNPTIPTEQSDDQTTRGNTHEALSVSYEFFPPKTDKGSEMFWGAVVATDSSQRLPKPSFYSITYGALGSDRHRSIDTVIQCADRVRAPVAAHITAAGQSKTEAKDALAQWYEAGVRRLVVLRGDAEIHADGYKDAVELIAGAREVGDFDIAVAAYPETHPKAASRSADLDVLQAKFDAGADRAITQFFFEAKPFLTLRDEMAARGVTQDIIPGILPIQNFAKIQTFATACGTKIPGFLDKLFAEALTQADPDQAQKAVGVDLATMLCADLIAEGVRQFHFYTLNTGHASRTVVENITTDKHIRWSAAA